MIILDSREPTKFRKLFILKGLKHEIKQLVTGDVICSSDAEPENKIVIERKRLDDLISSYYSGRIGDQFERLSHEKFAVLIVTGNFKDVVKKIPHRIMPQIVEEIMAMAIIQYNFRSIIWIIDGVADVHHNGYVTLVKSVQKVISGQLDAIPQKKSKLSSDLRVNALRHMLGLDTTSAKALLKKYGSVMEVLKLTDSQFLSVKGVGPAKLKMIRYILSANINHTGSEMKSKNDCEKCGNPMSITKMPGGNMMVCTVCIGSIPGNTRHT